MHLDLADDTSCRCGHQAGAHRHLRGGTECALCLDCPRFRPVSGRLRRLAVISASLVRSWLRAAAARLRGPRPQS